MRALVVGIRRVVMVRLQMGVEMEGIRGSLVTRWLRKLSTGGVLYPGARYMKRFGGFFIVFYIAEKKLSKVLRFYCV